MTLTLNLCVQDVLLHSKLLVLYLLLLNCSGQSSLKSFASHPGRLPSLLTVLGVAHRRGDFLKSQAMFWSAASSEMHGFRSHDEEGLATPRDVKPNTLGWHEFLGEVGCGPQL